MIAISEQHGFTLWSASANVVLGWARAEQGQQEEGIRQVREGLTVFRATGSEYARVQSLNELARICMRANRLDEALTILIESQAAVDRDHDYFYQAEIYRLRGELLLIQSPTNALDALRYFERAVAISRKQSTKSFELRAITSLARLLRDTGSCDEARTMLSEIYNWFTEGFDTADLKDAKALLDELAG